MTPRHHESDTTVRRGHIPKQGSKGAVGGHRSDSAAPGHGEDRRR
ncbi:hypothetical protein MOO23_39810 (plasmid) [Rhodococcus opacus]|nr:hypothetical protein [Rhodococcus opacus]UNN05153.1 hypothetical protein MOO23_39810 [Rhodococcus opacus]